MTDPKPFVIPPDLPADVMQYERGWNACLEALAASHRERSGRELYDAYYAMSHTPEGVVKLPWELAPQHEQAKWNRLSKLASAASHCAQGEAVARWTEIARDGQLSDWNLEMASLRKYFAGLASQPADKPAGQAVTDALIKAGNKLSFAAQISGGVAGRDANLVAAIEGWTNARDSLAPEPATAGDDPGEFGVGIRHNPKARYWQERAQFWCSRAIELGWREHRDAENGERATPAAAVPDGPLGVFADGPWTYGETGQTFTGADLDGAVYAAYRDAGLLAAAPNRPAAAQRGVPVDAWLAESADAVRERIEEGGGFWRTCSGCHETEDGHDVGHYPYSTVLQCKVGSGCGECGGIGAIWDTTDYEDMGKYLAASPADPLPASEVSHG